MVFQVVRFVLECDGTEFVNEEELMAFCDGSTTLLGIGDNEIWTLQFSSWTSGWSGSSVCVR